MVFFKNLLSLVLVFSFAVHAQEQQVESVPQQFLPVNPVPFPPTRPPTTKPVKPSNPEDEVPMIPIDEVRLRKGSLARLYWARVLIEDFRQWPKASELIRYVITNDKKIPAPVVKKLRRSLDSLVRHSPKEMVRKSFDFRHLTQPFLLTQYLLNECIMDLRVNLNFSNNIELKFVERALQTYFFPGTERVGQIIYPADATYQYDLYALSDANVAAARLAESDTPIKTETNRRRSSLPFLPPGGGGDGSGGSPGLPIVPIPPGGGGTIIPTGVINQGALDRMSLIGRQGLGLINPPRMVTPRGFLQQLIDLGIGLDELSQYAKVLIDDLKPSTRVENRYLPQALLMQAISDPGSIVLDPQLQDFLRGVKLKLEVDQLNKEEARDFIDLFNSLESPLVNKKKEENTWSIDLSNLMQEQYEAGASKTEILMEHDHRKGVGATLYIITGVGGADQSRMRLFQALFKIGKDASLVKAFFAKRYGGGKWAEFIAKIPQIFRNLRAKRLMLSRSKLFGDKLQSVFMFAPYIYYGGAQWIDNFLKLSHGLGKNKKVTEFIDKISKIKDVQYARRITDPIYSGAKKQVANGHFFYILTAAAVATEIFTGVIDFNSTDSEREKIEVVLRSSSNSLAHITYVVPWVGWPAIAWDTAKTIGWIEKDTAYWYSRAELFLYQKLISGDLTKRFLEEYEAELGLPESPMFVQAVQAELDNPESDPDAIKLSITSNLHELSKKYIILTYLGHKDAARFSRYSFGEKIEEYYGDFSEIRTTYGNMLQVFEERLEEGYYGEQEEEEDEEPVLPPKEELPVIPSPIDGVQDAP